MINKSLESGSEKVNLNTANWSDSLLIIPRNMDGQINIGCIDDVNGLLIYKSRLFYWIWCVVVSLRFQIIEFQWNVFFEKNMKNKSKQ